MGKYMYELKEELKLNKLKNTLVERCLLIEEDNKDFFL